MVLHLITVGLTGLVLAVAVPGTDLFSWHPTLMTIAFCLLMCQAIVIFSPESSLLQSASRQDKVQLHWILNVFSLLAAAGGFGAIYLNKEIASKPHFTTWHGKVGLATCLGALLAALGGLGAKYSSYLRSFAKPINVKLYHATGSLIVFTLSMITMCLACYSNWFRNRVDGFLWRCAFWSPIILTVCVARQVTQSYLPRVMKSSSSSAESKPKKSDSSKAAQNKPKTEKSQ